MSKLTDRVLRRETDPEIAEFLSEITSYWNLGRYQATVLSSAPSHTGAEGEFVFTNVGGTKSLYAWVGGAWKYVDLA